MKLTNKELVETKGGAITASLLNAVSRGVNTIYELGRNIGSTIRRISTGKYCKI